MGLGGTAKKLQKVANAAEELYAKMNEVIGQLKELRQEVERTSQQVDQIEYEVAQQRAVVDAIAEADGIDVESVLADADLPPEPDAESGDTDGADESATAEEAGDPATDGTDSPSTAE